MKSYHFEAKRACRKISSICEALNKNNVKVNGLLPTKKMLRLTDFLPQKKMKTKRLILSFFKTFNILTLHLCK